MKIINLLLEKLGKQKSTFLKSTWITEMERTA